MKAALYAKRGHSRSFSKGIQAFLRGCASPLRHPCHAWAAEAAPMSSLVIFLVFLLFVVSAADAKDPDFLLKQKKSVVEIVINDRQGNVIVSGSGFIADRDGIIATNCKLIVKWLDDVGNSLVVKTEDGGSYEIGKLFVFNRKQDIALFEIKAGGLTEVKYSSDYSHADYIRKQIAIYKKSAKAAKRETAPELQASVPDVSVPTLKPLPESSKAIIEKPADIPKHKKPDEAEEYFKRGLAYYKSGKYQEAIDAYRKALRLKPDASIYNKLATLHIIMNEYFEALDVLKQALDVDPYNPITRFNIGMAYFLSGNREAAMEEYILLNKIDRDRAENLFEMLYR
ncbi:MAG TPA: hypothetical protein DCP24_03855 [Nitrospiraceae bacterium]|nr:hypothetical protein [Nitrospiraceae bacterium]